MEHRWHVTPSFTKDFKDQEPWMRAVEVAACEISNNLEHGAVPLSMSSGRSSVRCWAEVATCSVKSAVTRSTVQSLSHNVRQIILHIYQELSIYGGRAVVHKLVVVKKLIIVKKLKNKVAWSAKCHMDMKILEKQGEFFKGYSMKLIDLEITKAKSPMWNHQEEITTARTSSPWGMSRWVECTSCNHHGNDWQNWPRAVETRQMETRPAGM